MATELQNAINSALETLPDEGEIRERIAENLKERLLLRQMLKLRQQADARAEGRKHG